MTPKNLQTQFKKEIAAKLMKDLNLKNANAVPKVTKITVNVGIGSIIQKQGKDFAYIVDNIAKITGQKPVITTAKKSISNFKTRIGIPVGIMVTLRGKRMYDFLSKLINITLPRVRDFRGLPPKSFDNKGNYSIGFKEHIMFPEINPDDVLHLHGVQITITTTAKDNKQGLALLKAFNFPFRTAQ